MLWNEEEEIFFFFTQHASDAIDPQITLQSKCNFNDMSKSRACV
jgi:hypothetical protein